MFALSAFFLLFISYVAAVRFGRCSSEKFWIFLASAVFQIGGIALTLSLIHQFVAVSWIVLHALVAAAAGILLVKTKPPALHSETVSTIAPWNGIEFALAFLIALFTLLTFFLQWNTPIFEGDEKMYHASRVLYWITNGSIFPYPTHNDRQTVFQFGSELFFLWPVLLTRWESVARSVFWLGVPLAIAGQWMLCSALGIKRVIALGTILLVMTTPIVTNYAPMLKPEMWSIVFFCGLLWWTTRVIQSQHSDGRDWFWLGVYFVLCLSIRSIEIVLLVPLVLLLWSRGSKESVVSFAAGTCFCLVLSAAFVPLAFNVRNSGHPLGPQAMRQFHASELSMTQIQTHASRFVLSLVELPEVPGSAGLISWNGFFRNVAEGAGANRILHGEKKTGWPGAFEFSQGETARNFSLGGILWLAAFGFSLHAILVGRKQIAESLTPSQHSAALLMATLTTAIVFGIRWMQHSGLPERFLITPYVAGVIIAASYLNHWILYSPKAQAFAFLLLSWAVAPSLRQLELRTGILITNPISVAKIDAPFAEALLLIPSHSNILLFGNHIAPDYPLFNPRQFFANKVFPWGKEKVDVLKLRSIIKEKRITHLLFQDSSALSFEWAPSMDVTGTLQWLSEQPDLPLLLSADRIQLFATEFSTSVRATDEQLRVISVPEKAPLLVVEKALEARVGLDADRLSTPWQIEDLGGDERGYLWLGTGTQGGISFGLWAKRNESIELNLDVEPGPSRRDSKRTVVVETALTHRELCRQVFEKREIFKCKVEIDAGYSDLRVFTPDERTIAAMPNGDPRSLIVGLHHVAIVAGTK